MKIITAFFMAWGNFITLPCPYKRWDSELKNMMLAFLPSIGAVVGGLWILLIWLLRKADAAYEGFPASLAVILCVFFLFNICGFMHLDGFMDCNDAILSRRPLEDRQRILKDSNVGAFAVVTVIFLLLTWYAAMCDVGLNGPLPALFLIPVLSRGEAGLSVMRYRPIGHSQYREDFEKPKTRVRIAARLQVVVYVAIAAAFAVSSEKLMISVIAVILAVGICGNIAGAYARKQLGGMSGDIAGYMICFGELAGIVALALMP